MTIKILLKYLAVILLSYQCYGQYLVSGILDSTRVTEHAHLNDSVRRMRTDFNNLRKYIGGDIIQNLKSETKEGIVTDSIMWRIVEVVYEGTYCAYHSGFWVYGDWGTVWNVNQFCDVLHSPGEHCSYRDRVVTRICSRCLRTEKLREVWYQNYYTKIEKPPQESEYEILKEKVERIKNAK